MLVLGLTPSALTSATLLMSAAGQTNAAAIDLYTDENLPGSFRQKIQDGHHLFNLAQLLGHADPAQVAAQSKIAFIKKEGEEGAESDAGVKAENERLRARVGELENTVKLLIEPVVISCLSNGQFSQAFALVNRSEYLEGMKSLLIAYGHALIDGTLRIDQERYNLADSYRELADSYRELYEVAKAIGDEELITKAGSAAANELKETVNDDPALEIAYGLRAAEILLEIGDTESAIDVLVETVFLQNIDLTGRQVAIEKVFSLGPKAVSILQEKVTHEVNDCRREEAILHSGMYDLYKAPIIQQLERLRVRESILSEVQSILEEIEKG